MAIAVGRAGTEASICPAALIPGTEPGFSNVLAGSDMGLNKPLAIVALLKMEVRQWASFVPSGRVCFGWGGCCSQLCGHPEVVNETLCG